MKLVFPTFAVAVSLLMISYINGAAQSDPNSGSVDAKVISLPKPRLPKEAKETGLGGRVSVLVEIDAKGNILSASDVMGPDSTCPAVVRPDVIALREAAKAAALNGRFLPATRDGVPKVSTLRLDFEFETPEKKQKDSGGTTGAKVITQGASDQDTGSFGRLVKDSDTPNESPKKMKVAVGSADTSSSSTTDGNTAPPPASLPNISGRTISGGVLNGSAMKLAKPQYPPAARAIRVTGTVSVQVLIDTDGTMFSAQAISGHPFLRRSSEIAACDSRFSPTLLEGQPVRVSGIITYNYVP